VTKVDQTFFSNVSERLQKGEIREREKKETS
jgi:hypothetical protein